MKLLAIDTSSLSASVALLEDNKTIGEFFINTKLTHSQTIMPMIENLLSSLCISIKEIDIFAVSTGPGSFTGLRIGISAVKGMAHSLNKPCISVSTLGGLAYNLTAVNGVIAPVMDARCSQVYTSLFRCENNIITRLSDDKAVSVADLEQTLLLLDDDIFFVGDGAVLCYNEFGINYKNIKTAPEQLLYQRAASVGKLAYEKYLLGDVISAAQLAPEYIRLPQAERELKARLKQN